MVSGTADTASLYDRRFDANESFTKAFVVDWRRAIEGPALQRVLRSYFHPTKGAKGAKGAGGKGKGKGGLGGLGGIYVVESSDELALSRSRSTRRMGEEAGGGEGGGGEDGDGVGGSRDGSKGIGSNGNGSSGNGSSGGSDLNLPFDAPALQPLKNALQGHYYLIYTMFNHYATLGSGNGFSLQLNAFSQYVLKII